MRPLAVLVASSVFLMCQCAGTSRPPAIELTRVPPADPGGPDTREVIEGRVTGALPGQRVVLFSKGASRVWWVQPEARQPYTTIQPDATFRNFTTLGTDYAALLVDPDYQAPARLDVLPDKGNGVAAIVAVAGPAPSGPV